MIGKGTVFILALAGAASVGLFSVKYRVQDLEGEFDRLTRSVTAERQAIHVLEAEWSHFNEPGRLRRLAERYLGLAPLATGQIQTSLVHGRAPGGDAERRSPATIPVARDRPAGDATATIPRVEDAYIRTVYRAIRAARGTEGAGG